MKSQLLKTTLLTALTLLILTKEASTFNLFGSSGPQTFYFSHSVPVEKKHPGSAFILDYFKIENGESGIEVGKKMDIKIRGVVLRETRIKTMDLKIKLGPVPVFTESNDLGVSDKLIRKGPFSIDVGRDLMPGVKSCMFSLKVNVVLKDIQGTVIADYSMDMKVTKK